MPQTSYLREFGYPYAGQIADGNPIRSKSVLNKTGGSFNAGLAVKNNGTVGEVTTLAAVDDQIDCVTALKMDTDPDSIAGTYNFHEGVEMLGLEQGAVWVAQDFAVAAGEPVYVRFAAGAGTVNVPGAFGNSADGGACRLVKGAVWLDPGTGVAGSPALLKIDVLTDQATR